MDECLHRARYGARLQPAQLSGPFFVIVNNKLARDFEVVENSPLPVVVRSFLTMVKANTRETLLATYQFARTHGIEFNLAAFDPSYPHSTTISFDRDYMQRLFQYGFERARSGKVWQQTIVPTASTPARERPYRRKIICVPRVHRYAQHAGPIIRHQLERLLRCASLQRRKL
jgi:hypothetical protein